MCQETFCDFVFILTIKVDEGMKGIKISFGNFFC